MKVVYATANAFLSRGDGTAVQVFFGTHWPANDPLVLRHPDSFTDDPMLGLQSTVPVRAEQGAEAATREPGEKRQVVRRPAEPAA